MKQIHFATTNKGKVFSIQKSLAEYNVELVHVDLVLPEPRSEDLNEIAGHKASFAYSNIKKPCIALDAGFYINSLNGFPSSYVNFALKKIGLEGILKLVEGKNRDCYFETCLAYLDESISTPLFFNSYVKGVLSDSIKGEAKDYQWSELWRIFIPEGENKTLAEMTLEEYENWRSRRLNNSAISKFGGWYSRRDNWVKQ